jgi:Helix-turn-helix domain
MFTIPHFQVEFTPTTRILRGLDEIAAYLKVHRRTAWRWCRDYDLPAMQAPSGAWQTSTSLIDLWIIAVSKAQRAARTGKVSTQARPVVDIDALLD